jgi:hypothetical protein
MSDVEKVRAASFLSIITIVLVVLVAMQERDARVATPARETIELCAVTKGALCHDAVESAERVVVREQAPVELGQMVVVGERLLPQLVAATDAASIQAAHVIEF